MRYWFFDEAAKRATGPHLDMVLSRLPGFGPEARVSPAGPGAVPEWKRAAEIPELQKFLSPQAPPPQKPK